MMKFLGAFEEQGYALFGIVSEFLFFGHGAGMWSFDRA